MKLIWIPHKVLLTWKHADLESQQMAHHDGYLYNAHTCPTPLPLISKEQFHTFTYSSSLLSPSTEYDPLLSICWRFLDLHTDSDSECSPSIVLVSIIVYQLEKDLEIIFFIQTLVPQIKESCHRKATR